MLGSISNWGNGLGIVLSKDISIIYVQRRGSRGVNLFGIYFLYKSLKFNVGIWGPLWAKRKGEMELHPSVPPGNILIYSHKLERHWSSIFKDLFMCCIFMFSWWLSMADPVWHLSGMGTGQEWRPVSPCCLMWVLRLDQRVTVPFADPDNI